MLMVEWKQSLPFLRGVGVVHYLGSFWLVGSVEKIGLDLKGVACYI
jgi:hypothetical protein